MKIVITGSLGHIGRPLTGTLTSQGHAVTVISSNAGRQAEIQALGATAAIGSLEDAAFITAAFTGADAVYVMIPPSFGEPDQMAYYQRLTRHYVQAIQEAGVKRVVALSSYGAHLDRGTGIILGSHHMETMLNALQGVAISYLRPGYFYYNLYNFAPMIKAAGIMGSNYSGDRTIALVHPADIAAAAADELTATTATTSVRYVASDERTPDEIAAVLGAAIGKPELKWVAFTNEQVQQSLEQNKVPASMVHNLVELGMAIQSGRLLEEYRLNRPSMEGTIKLEAFAKAFAAAF